MVAVRRSTLRPGSRFPARRDLDLDAHPRIDEAGDERRARRPDLTEILAQDGPAGGEVLGPREDVDGADNVRQGEPRLVQSGADVVERLTGLLRSEGRR